MSNDAATVGRPWTAHILTLYPQMFPGPLAFSLAGQALKTGLWCLETVDIRDFARDKHRSVDDAPFGGGPGMVLRPDVVARAIDSVAPGFGESDVKTAGRQWARLCLTPRGAPLDQARIRHLAACDDVMVLCGHFEGIDQRVIDARGLEEVSVADVVLSGGEIAALMLVDACVRLLPGVVGDAAVLAQESFEGDLLEYPHYTRPRVWEGQAVPDILLSGHHGQIAAWRRDQAARTTRVRRPDLWARRLRRQGDDR